MKKEISEAVVEHGFSRMGQITMKKRCALDDRSLDLLMRISYRKEPLKNDKVKHITAIWKNTKDRRIFSENI